MKRGDPARYRSMSGDIYDAVLTSAPREDGTVSLDVLEHWSGKPVLELSRVLFCDGPSEQRATAWARETESGEAAK